MSPSARRIVRSAMVISPSLFRTINAARALAREIMRQPHDRDFEAIPLLNLPPGALFLDIGANGGQAAQSIFSVMSGARIISFEPNPLHWASLDRIRRRFPTFSYFGCALSDAEVSTYLYWPKYNGCQFTPLASLDEGTARRWLNSSTLVAFDPSKLELERVPIAAKTLDSFRLAPHFIKIDVEGATHRVLAGGLATIRSNRPVLLIEAGGPGDPTDELLSNLGYTPFSYLYKARRLVRGTYGTVNTFFIPDASLG
jgi:FkbM family methyltransferase